jgi:hypothetical protein
MIDLSNKTIEQLFHKQIKRLTMDSKLNSFDKQFNDFWI